MHRIFPYCFSEAILIHQWPMGLLWNPTGLCSSTGTTKCSSPPDTLPSCGLAVSSLPACQTPKLPPSIIMYFLPKKVPVLTDSNTTHPRPPTNPMPFLQTQTLRPMWSLFSVIQKMPQIDSIFSPNLIAARYSIFQWIACQLCLHPYHFSPRCNLLQPNTNALYGMLQASSQWLG